MAKPILKVVQPHQGNLDDYGSTWMQHLRVYLQGKAKDAIRNGVKMNQMALHAHISMNTLSNFIYMVTKHPRATTLDGIIEALNLYEEVGQQMIDYGKRRHN